MFTKSTRRISNLKFSFAFFLLFTSTLCAENSTLSPFEKVKIPSGYADITEKYEGTSDFCVIHIQDAHCVYDAQKNINAILNSLTSDNTVSLIAIEGAQGNIDTKEFSSFPNKNAKKIVSDYMMRTGRISGVEYFSINKKNNTLITGLENRKLYVENSVQFKQVLRNKSLTDQIFARLTNLQKLLENHLYPPQTKILLRLTEDYHKGRLQLTDYIKHLFLYADKKNIDLSAYPNLQKINTVNRLKKSINFLSVDQERVSLINSLSAKMNNAELKSFLHKNMIFKLNQMSQEEFHVYLSELMTNYDLDKKNYPELSKFFGFITEYESINWRQVVRECELLNKNIISLEINDPVKKSLIKTGKHLNTAKKMFSLSLPVYQFDDYLKNKDTLNPLTIYRQITDLASKLNINTDFNKDYDINILTRQLPIVENFYYTAKKRDNILFTNLIYKIKQNKVKRAVFIAGGFHSEGITNYLRKNDISYMVVVPRINKIPNSTPYLSLIMNQQSFYEIYLSKSTLAIASWLEQNPMVSPERKVSFGYKMKSLMLGAFTYDVSKQKPDKIKADSQYIETKVLSLLKQWGHENYGEIEFVDTAHIGPFLCVTLNINGKEVILLFTDKAQDGKAVIETGETKNLDIVFNSSGELNLLEEDDLADLHFQVITPQGLETLNKYARHLNAKSAQDLRKAVKQKMEERLTTLIMENQISGPDNFRSLLKQNSIFLTDEELSEFFNLFKIYPLEFLSATFFNNLANNTILGAYLSIKAKDKPISATNESLPLKAKNRFYDMGFDEMYIEQGIPVHIMKNVFRKLSFKDIDIESDLTDFYIGADDSGVYYLHVIKRADGKTMLKVTHSSVKESNMSPRIDPTVIDEIIASTKLDRSGSAITTIAPIKTAVAFAEFSDDKIKISILDVDENFKFFRTGLETTINIKDNLSDLESSISELQSKALDNNMRLFGITVDSPKILQDHTFFSNIEDFIHYYQIKMVKTELINRHKQQFPDQDISLNILSNELIGQAHKILLTTAMVTTDKKSSVEFITEKLNPSPEGYRLNIGLGEFLEDRFANLETTPTDVTPQSRFTARYQGKIYELVKNALTGKIHMRLPNNTYSRGLTDGEIEFIKQSSSVFPKNSIEHTSPNLPTPSADVKKRHIRIDRWSTANRAVDSKSLYELTTKAAPFLANQLFDYERYLKDTFGLPVTVFDLLGYQGIYTQQVFAQADEYASELKFDPFIVTRDIFDASIAKNIIDGLGFQKERVIPAFSAQEQVSSIKQALINLKKLTHRKTDITPHVVSLLGSSLELGVVSYEDAVNLVRDTWDIMPDGGLLFIAGSDYLALQAQDFENIGFEILEMGNPQSFFNDTIAPKQYYVLRKKSTPQPVLLEQAAVVENSGKPDDAVSAAQLNLSPVNDVMDFFIKISEAPITFTSNTDGQKYTLKMVPKIKVHRPDGSTHMAANLSNETIKASVDNKLYFELFLNTEDTSSILPVIDGVLSMDLESISISKTMLDSVNFGGNLKNLNDIDFVPMITRLFQQLMPEGATLTQALKHDYKTICSIYQILPVQQHSETFATVKSLIKKADEFQLQGKPINDILTKIYYHIPTFLSDIKSVLSNPEYLTKANYNIRKISEEPFIKNLLNAGFNNLSLSTDEKGNIFIEAQKRQAIVNVIAQGKLRKNIFVSTEVNMSEQNIDRINKTLLSIGKELEIAHKVTEEYFRSLNFALVDNLNTQYKISSKPNTIVLDYSLFQEDFKNNDLLRLEIQEGLQRQEFKQLNKISSIKNIPQHIQELFILLSYVQSFIDIRQANPDDQEGKKRQANILNTLNTRINPDERAIYKVLQFAHNNNIKNAWAVRDILINLITAQGDFAGNSIYPEEIRDKLSKTDPDTLVREINRIIELKEYWFTKNVITRSRTSKYTLNIRAHKELSIKEILSGNDIQIANLKIQNFKDVFNTFGSDLGISHTLGDIGIFVISRLLREEIENKLAPLGVKTLIANNGGEFFISFTNVKNINVTEIIRNIIQDPDKQLQSSVITECKKALKDFFPQNKFTAIEQRFDEGFTADKINFYGGVSTHYNSPIEKGTNPDDVLDPKTIQEAALTVDRLYKEAFQTAKHEQIQFSSKYADIRKQAIAKKNLPDTTERDLVNIFQPVVADAAKILKSSIMQYSDKAMDEIKQNLRLGLVNEYQIFHPQIAPRYHSYANMERLSRNLQTAIENGEDQEVLGELKDRLLESVVRYQSNNLLDDYIYEGNENFKRVINYVTSHKPDFPISVTFRVGGDEYGKIIWNEKDKTLQIYRFDGNNVGATNFEWGMDIGDKLIDESLRIISQTDDMSKLQEAIDNFFNDMGDRGLVLSDSSLDMLKQKAANLLILSEKNYSLLKSNGTFKEFTKNNSAVVIEKKDGDFVLIKFPDIHVPYPIQKSEHKFDKSKLPTDETAENAMPISFLSGEEVFDFIMINDKKTGGLILSSKNPRAPPLTKILPEDIANQSPITIAIEGKTPITISFKKDFRSNVIVKGNILTLNEKQFQKIKLSKNKLTSKNDNLAVMVTSRPVVSTGVVKIDTNKIQPQYLNRDISVIQGRADTAAEHAKETVKLNQILHNKVIKKYTIASSDYKFTGTPEEINSFNEFELSFFDMMTAEYILETPEEKLSRRIDYLLNPNRKLNANDIFILSKLYIESPDNLTYKQKNYLLRRMMDTYINSSNKEITSLITYTTIKILSSQDRLIWEPAVNALFRSFSNKNNAKKIEALFLESISLIANKTTDDNLVEKWRQTPPIDAAQWYKSLIDRKKTDVLSELYNLPYKSMIRLYKAKNNFLPMAAQYSNLFASGEILQSKITDEEKEFHDLIINNQDVTDYKKINALFDFAYNKIKQVLAKKTNWINIETDLQDELTRLIIGSRILEDTVMLVYGHSLNLGDVKQLTVKRGQQTNIDNAYIISIKLEDGTTFSDIKFNILPTINAIKPNNLKKYFTTGALHRFIENAKILNATDASLHPKAGNFYAFHTDSRHFYKILTTVDRPQLTSKHVIAKAQKSFTGSKLSQEIVSTIKKDIIAYMRVWDVLGRNSFFSAPYPNNILAGTEIRSLIFMDDNVHPGEILKRFYEGYSEYEDWPIIFSSIVEFFKNYDPQKQLAGFIFLAEAYSYLKDQNQPELTQQLELFLKQRIEILKLQMESHVNLQNDVFAEILHLHRIFMPQDNRSLLLNKALAYLEKKALNDSSFQLTYSVFEEIIEKISSLEQLHKLTRKNLEYDLMGIFKNYGYDPQEELLFLITNLHYKNTKDATDQSLAKLISNIEKLEELIGLKAKKDFFNFTANALVFNIHPYSSPAERPSNLLEPLKYKDAKEIFKHYLKTHTDNQTRPFIVGISGRPDCGKISLTQKLIQKNNIIDRNDSAIIDISEFTNPEGVINNDLLQSEFDRFKDKKAVFVLGTDILLNQPLQDQINFDYTVFVESNEQTRIRHMLEDDNEKALSRIYLDNILFRWGTGKPEYTGTLSPQGLDTQRANANLVIDMSDPHTQPVQQPIQQYSAETLVNSASPKLDKHLEAQIVTNINAIYGVFDNNIRGKELAVFEPEHPAIPLILAQMGFQVMVLSEKKFDYNIDVETQYRIRKAGGSVNHFWGAKKTEESTWGKNRFDFIYLSNANDMLNSDSIIYNKSRSETIMSLISRLNENGIILLKPGSLSEEFKNNIQQDSFQLTPVFSDFFKNTSSTFLRKLPEGQIDLVTANLSDNQNLTDRLQQIQNEQAEQTSTVITINFDDIKTYSNQWDALIFVEALKRKTARFQSQNIPVQYAFISTNRTVQNMRNYLGLTEYADLSNFLFVGKEDITDIPAGTNKFDLIPQRLTELSGNPLANIILMESRESTDRHLPKQAIVFDISDILINGFNIEDILRMQSFIETTLLNNKIDSQLIVEKISPDNPLFSQTSLSAERDTHLGSLISNRNISFANLKGIVLTAPNLRTKKKNMRQKLQYHELVEQSM